MVILSFNDKEREKAALSDALEIYKAKNAPFGTIHVDIPLAIDTEISLLKESKFSKVTIEKRWTNTSLIKAVK